LMATPWSFTKSMRSSNSRTRRYSRSVCAARIASIRPLAMSPCRRNQCFRALRRLKAETSSSSYTSTTCHPRRAASARQSSSCRLTPQRSPSRSWLMRT
jgi:hypothetical protein